MRVFLTVPTSLGFCSTIAGVVCTGVAVFASTTRMASAQSLLLNHSYFKPEAYASARSPCPGLNTLANHGYINRDGRNISVTDLEVAIERVFGIERAATAITLDRALEKIAAAGVASDGETPTLNLPDLYAHNKIEHDASLVRRDEYLGGPFAQFDQELFQGLIARATLAGNLTQANVVRYQMDRIYDSRRNNPEASFHHDDKVADSIAKDDVLLMFFGNDPYLDSVPVDWLRIFLEENRIPDKYLSRQERGLDLVHFFRDNHVLARLRPIAQQLATAMTLPLTETAVGVQETSLSISSTKETPLDAVMEDLRLYMKDFGNNKVVTYIPDRPLERFFENMGRGVLPLTAQFYAGAKGASATSIRDKARRYPLLLKPMERTPGKRPLPDLDEIFDKLFLREDFIPETRVSGNMLLVSFANWFLDEVFHTEPNTDGAFHRFPSPSADQCEVSNDISLKPLYGTDSSRERALRLFKNGKLKTGPDGGLPSLPQIREDYPDFTMICGWNKADTSCYEDDSFYATGHERFNFHPGHLIYTELFLREHNYLAETLQEQNPGWDDQTIFQTARLILTHTLLKIILNEYISNAVSTAQDYVMFGYDPARWREADYDKMTMHVSLEFNHVYRWHGMVAEQLDFAQDGMVAFQGMLWKPSVFREQGAPNMARALHRTRMGALEAHNTPEYLRGITTQTIADERAQSMQGYNAYREYFTLPKLKSFEDMQAGPEATKALKEMYESVDDIELFVGAMVEQRFTPGTTFMSEILLVSIASQALSGVLNQAAIKDPFLYSEESLTKFGLDYVDEASLSSMLKRHFELNLPCGTPLLLEGKAACDYIAKPTEWTMGNLVDFVGLDFVLETFFEESFFFGIFKVSLVLVLALFGSFLVVHQFMIARYKFYRDMEILDKFRFVYGVVNAIELLVTAVPYSYYASLLLFGPDLVDVVETNYRALFGFLLAHGLLYVVETCARLVYTKAGMLLFSHHSMWFFLIYLAALTESVFLFKVVFVLDAMVSFEAGLFVALLYRRYSDNLKLRIRTILWGNWVFLFTRIIQTVLLCYLFIKGAPRMTSTALDIFIYTLSLFAAIVLSALQLYTMVIYYGFYLQDIAKLESLVDRPEEVIDSAACPTILEGDKAQESSNESSTGQDQVDTEYNMEYDIDHRTGQRTSLFPRGHRRRSSMFSVEGVGQVHASIRMSVLKISENMGGWVEN